MGEKPGFSQAKWLFFDIGSTLTDEEAVYRARFEAMAAASGKTLEQVRSLALEHYRQNRKGDKQAAKALGIPLPPWRLELERPYPGAFPCLEALSRRYRLGDIANQLPGARERLEKWGLLPYFEVVISSAEAGVSKPDLRIFTLALERADCTPAEAVMIGDRIDNDILPAKALGLGTVWVRQGYSGLWRPKGGQEQPDMTVGSLEELTARLAGD